MRHTHCMCAGEEVCISIRPDSLEMDEKGQLEGMVKQFTYTGEAIDVVITVTTSLGKEEDLLVHVHPEENVNIGDVIRFKVLPNFVAVVKND
ncbi:TOBE domain-containing protein [Anaerovirgula multivorans]|uniref:TOBE domain-containing protein n=1 Tax=Anaerovirgula multivorans TaxID=312168 RepID=A0A239HBB4_9FIRM|nr:TOBE domain-containing protein [Anaerovirgula multivorans]